MPGIRDPREAILYARLFLRFLTDNMLVADRASGRPVTQSDALGFLQWLAELEVIAEKQLGLPPRARVHQHYADCPDCGHIHADEKECGFPIGGGRTCRCERVAVSA